MALIHRAATVGFASFAGRVWLRLLNKRGGELAHKEMSLEEFNQLVADCLALQDQIRGPLIIVPRPCGGKGKGK